MPTKLEDTARRISRRKYEAKRKEERKQTSGNFQAMMPRDKYEEINSFLQENNITKVDLVIAGYEAMKAQLSTKGEKQTGFCAAPLVKVMDEETMADVKKKLQNPDARARINKVNAELIAELKRQGIDVDKK